jgi:hypothetical protein
MAQNRKLGERMNNLEIASEIKKQLTYNLPVVWSWASIAVIEEVMFVG